MSVSCLVAACSSPSDADPSAGGAPAAAASASEAGMTQGGATPGVAGVGQSGSAANGGAGSRQTGSGGGPSSPMLGGCAMFPASHLFNTAIAGFPVHADSKQFMTAIGSHRVHLDLGTSVNQAAADYYGIPYNVVHSKTGPWASARYASTDTANLSWDPTSEADCAAGDTHTLASPCTASVAPKPEFPIPDAPLVEGGIVRDPSQPYGDHHLLLLDADTCSLWELYHVYPGAKGGWDIFGSAYFDLKTNRLRPAGWTSADAAGFPILPLLLRADEASSGVIEHALRFTIATDHIRRSYTWPARHLTSNGTSSGDEPPMGQAFRIKSSFTIPSSFNAQSRAILQALKTYGMYIADGGSPLYIQGEPSARWESDTFDQVQSVSSDAFEAVDLSSISQRPGFDPDSATVP